MRLGEFSPAPLRASFTLIELLVVIAIVAVLSVVVILVVNPAELLRQARDSTRLADMDTLARAISLYEVQALTSSPGNASTTYFSIIDPAATTTQGTSCAGVGLVPPSGWTYHCAASSTLKKVDGTGWLPVNFDAIAAKPISILPVDPVNTSSSGHYYSYTPGGSFAISALLESQKYLATAEDDGGYDPGRIEKGSDLALVSRSQGLMGWWRFDEGSGAAVRDSSGNGNDGTWSAGNLFASGKVGPYAGNFNALYWVGMGKRLTNAWPVLTYGGWFKSGAPGNLMNEWNGGANFAMTLNSNGKINIYMANAGVGWQNDVSAVLMDNAWHQAYVVYDGSREHLYVDGVEVFSVAATGNIVANNYNFKIGANENAGVPGGFFGGLMDDVRIYNRALSAAEIAAIYNAQR